MRVPAPLFLLLLALVPTAPPPAAAQEVGHAVIGGGLGVAGGVAVTMAAVVARARFEHEYVHEPGDLIHWQSTPMIAAPAAGVAFGLAGEEALKGSIVGSITGLAVGAGVGAALGWILSDEAEWPWAGGVIGGGMGLAIGGLAGGLLAWRDRESDGGPRTPVLTLSIPL